MSADLFNYASVDSPVVYCQGRFIRLGQLLKLVSWLSEKIPDHQHILNLYDDRFYFLLGFLLGIRHQSISLFPSTITDHIYQHLKDQYADILVVADQNISGNDHQYFDLKPWVEQFFSDPSLQQIQPADFSSLSLCQQIAIIFTSGSTGQPKPYKKKWGDLAATVHNLSQHLLSIPQNKSLRVILATVPSQHMYGLESSIIMALQNGMLIHSIRPFFPQDITHCLEDIQAIADIQQSTDITLITTPLHLKACIKTNVALPGVQRFISATAVLDRELAQQCENNYSAPVLEIYGCTEVGSIAWRHNTETEQWAALEDIHLESVNNGVYVRTNRSIQQFLLNDDIELLDDQHFLLKGRKEDLINLAGKRTSLTYLNHHLQSLDDLNDACYFFGEQLIAFVVLKDDQENKPAQKQWIQLIREHLKSRIDPVFLPKRIFFVNHLPRNATGKLPRSELKKILTHIESGS